MSEWQGDNPYYLMLQYHGESGDIEVRVIDLDSHQWATTHADVMRLQGEWYLVDKITRAIPIAIRVYEGEQPYYTARHVGSFTTPPGEDGEFPLVPRVTAYGLGKKRVDGHVDRLWVFRNGLVVAGDDVNDFAKDVLSMMNRGLIRPPTEGVG